MNTLLSKFLIACLFILSSFLVWGESPQNLEVHVLVKVHSVKDAEAQLGVAIELENAGLSKMLSGLAPDDEVLLKGHVTYHQTNSDGQILMNPKFHIESIHPVSLKRLGVTAVPVQEPRMTFSSAPYPGPKSLQVSPEVAGAITFTASALMLQNLTGMAESQPLKYEIDRAMFFSAGVLATGYFIWKQISEKKK